MACLKQVIQNRFLFDVYRSSCCVYIILPYLTDGTFVFSQHIGSVIAI